MNSEQMIDERTMENLARVKGQRSPCVLSVLSVLDKALWTDNFRTRTSRIYYSRFFLFFSGDFLYKRKKKRERKEESDSFPGRVSREKGTVPGAPCDSHGTRWTCLCTGLLNNAQSFVKLILICWFSIYSGRCSLQSILVFSTSAQAGSVLHSTSFQCLCGVFVITLFSV